ncbi:peptidase C14, caspase domain-containing protein, partial [Armillaria borealis]
AVVIGIDGYETSALRGCVSDAKMVVEYLTSNLHVPGNHIQLLLRISKPTCANIIKAILGLSTNTDIQHGDNILIYFAGHGTTYECADYPQYEKETAAALGTIEALCPIDRRFKPTATGIPDISDREINTILAEIAKKKGNHTTFILDCCHSFSITRG